MFNNPFRFANEDPEIIKARIHEEAETKRHRVSQCEETKRAAFKARDTLGYIIPKVVFGAVLVLGGLIANNSYSDHLRAASPATGCSDEAFKIQDYSHNVCSSPLANGQVEGQLYVCHCPTHDRAK